MICNLVSLPAAALIACAVLSQSASNNEVTPSPVRMAVSARIAALLVSVIAPLATTTAPVLQAVILPSIDVVSVAIVQVSVSIASVAVLIALIFTSSVAITTLWLPALLFPEFTSVAVPAIFATFTFSDTLPPQPVVCVITLYAAVSEVPVVAFLPYIIPVL